MVLTKKQKKVLKETVSYYIETTGNNHEQFISEASEPQNRTTYARWLTNSIMDKLSEYDITYKDCLVNKDVLNETKNEDSSREEGEFYTPEVWCVEGRNHLKEVLGDKWGKVYIWDASSGTGNLMRTEGYPQDKLFLSTLLEEDIPLLKEQYPEATIFSCDFLSDLDLDTNNQFFTNKLPQKLQDVLRNNEDLLFYMNPPYRQGATDRTDVGKKMTTNGLTRSGLDLFNQFMYRILLLKDTHNLTNLYAGIFGPLTMFHSVATKELYDMWVDAFHFEQGMCFDASEFASTSTSIGWIVGYTTWRLRNENEEPTSEIILQAKRMGSDNKVEIFGEKLVTTRKKGITEWALPKDIVSKDSQLPYGTTHVNFGKEMEYKKVYDKSLGFLMTSDYVIKGTRRTSVTSIVLPDSITITEENILRCIASFGVRRTYISGQTAYDNSQYYQEPKVDKEGYEKFIANCLVLFLFDTSSQFFSYRGAHSGFKNGNKMFPLSSEEVKTLVTDENILSDIETYKTDNSIILGLIEEYKPHMSKEALDLMNYCIGHIKRTLQGSLRKEQGYKNETIAWDSSFLQLREVPELVSKEAMDEYLKKLSLLRHVNLENVYEYGFLQKTAFKD